MEHEKFRQKEQLLLERLSEIKETESRATAIASQALAAMDRVEKNATNTKVVLSEFLEIEKSGLRKAREEIDAKQLQLEAEIASFERRKERHSEQVKLDFEAIERLSKEKSLGFPWLAKAYGDYFELRDKRIEEYLVSKSRPAFKAAEAVKEISAERRHSAAQFKIAKYLLDYYENLFSLVGRLQGRRAR